MSLENACHQWLIDHLSPGRDLAPDAPTPRITLPDDATFGGIRRRVLAAYTTSATAHPGRTAIPARRTPLTPVPDLPPENPVGGVLCARCGQPLTSAESIRRGMGPNCAKKTQQGL